MHEGTNDYAPFVKYTLGIIVSAYREFSSRVKLLSTSDLSKPDRVREIIKDTLEKSQKLKLQKCPDISQVTVRALNDLLKKGEIIKIMVGVTLHISGMERKNNMITGELKNKIDSLWDIFAAGGLVNPLDVIEQITYLMFIRDLDDSDNLRAESAMLGLPYQSIFAGEVQVGERKIDGSQLKWSTFRDFPAGKLYSDAGMGIPLYQKPSRRQKQRLFQIYG